jgi:predicted transposase YdaD
MKKSVTYQAIVEEGVQKGLVQGLERGRLEGARRLLLRQGEQRFGKPASEKTRAQLEEVPSLVLLEHLADRVLQVQSWDDYLAEIPSSLPRRTRKKS